MQIEREDNVIALPRKTQGSLAETINREGWNDIASAPSQERVMVGHVGFLGWSRLAIKNALGEWSYDDRPWLQQDPLDKQPTHWMPLPPPPSDHVGGEG